MSNSDRYALTSYASMVVGAWATIWVTPSVVTAVCVGSFAARLVAGYVYDRITKEDGS